MSLSAQGRVGKPMSLDPLFRVHYEGPTVIEGPWETFLSAGAKVQSATPVDILAATHALGYITVKGVTCETCGGTGTKVTVLSETPNEARTHIITDEIREPCPANCINGLTPSPEAIEAAGAAMWDGSVHGQDIYKGSDTVLINFDDGGSAPYPLKQVGASGEGSDGH